jgi:putative DNA primase/helicase
LATKLDWALRYIRLGWAVIPLRGKVPLCDEAKTFGAVNGSTSATLSEALVRQWWGRWPDANIGIATGGSFFVIDVDTKSGGDETWGALRARHGVPPDTIEQITGTGGRHILFGLPNFPVKNSQGKLGPGVDVRGTGGYIVACPSIHPETKRSYAWDGLAEIEDQKITPAPAWLLDLLRDPKKSKSRLNTPKAIPEGGRNDALFRRAASLRRHGLSVDEIFETLMAMNRSRCKPPLSAAEVRAIAASGARYTPAASDHDAEDFTPWPNDPVASPPCIPLGETIHSRALVESKLLADAGNAARFVLKYREDARYCFERKAWFIWNGKIWAEDNCGRAWLMAEHTMVDTLHQADAAQDDVVKKWALKSLNEPKIHGMLKSVSGKLLVSVATLDANPDKLVFANGTVDLQSGALGPFVRSDFITKMIDHDYLPNRECPLFLSWLATTMGGGPDASEEDLSRADRMVDALQSYLGYSMTGWTSEKLVFFVVGPSNSGKTTFLEVFHLLLGAHATRIDVNSLMDLQRTGNAKDDIADLRGARFAISSEAAEGQRLDEAGLKLITQGAGVIKTARKYEHHIQFPETHKLWIDSNFKPVVRSNDASIWNRILLLPFERVVPDGEIDRNLLTKLMAEAPGILAWGVRGAVRWYQSGKRLPRPAEVQAAVDEYRFEMDAVGQFLSECCIKGAEHTIGSSVLYRAYHRWAVARGERKPMTQAAFSLRLKGRSGIRIRHTSTGNLVDGVALITEELSE